MNFKDLLQKQYGVATDDFENPLTATVPVAAPVQLLQNDPSRVGWSLINLGAHPIYVSFDPEPSDTNGLYVAAHGGTISLVWNEDFELITKAIWAIADTADVTVYLVGVKLQ
jgi:hypothetical protein